MDNKICITVPNLVGARASVQDMFVAVNVSDFSSHIVEVDFRSTESIIQGACDEIVKQLIAFKAARVLFISASDRTENFLALAKRLRAEQGTFVSTFV